MFYLFLAPNPSPESLENAAENVLVVESEDAPPKHEDAPSKHEVCEEIVLSSEDECYVDSSSNGTVWNNGKKSI